MKLDYLRAIINLKEQDLLINHKFIYQIKRSRSKPFILSLVQDILAKYCISSLINLKHILFTYITYIHYFRKLLGHTLKSFWHGMLPL
jgi:hypothetical protein